MPKASTPGLPESAPISEAKQASLPTRYEDALRELETLVRNLESGELPLDQLLSGYQRGAALLQTCRDQLAAVEDQIKVLDDGVAKAWKPL